ncbi:MAG: hypothetical protein A3F40_03860 [Chlamydiae bacterium RIFCSPHIGHO2_12_FULL_27_8]|nr:MAG: hypothetical protein A3F40_03860 [Chlamydiae bacterium RIFCSPHIGHO2_12_FULL_27_8]
MKLKNLLIAASLLLTSTGAFAMQNLGVVNFMTCITDSKYGKSEQAQLESIKKRWTDLIENSEKEYKEVSAKFEDQEYLDSLSPEAEDELKMKQKSLQEDIMQYQNQLYQVMNQANYFFVQKITANISKASEKVASEKKIDLVLNKEACFYNNAKIDITSLVIKEMDKDFEKETAKAETSKTEISQAEISQEKTTTPLEEKKE